MLELSKVVKRYRGNTALDGVSLQAVRGEIFALLGPTGAGKSTSLLCIAGLEPVTSGHIALHGKDITTINPLERDMAMVFEGFNLLPILSVRDNIELALRSPVYRQTENEIRKRVDKVASRLHIDHLLERNVETLSGGETQRVAIARVMVRRPLLYLLDEPLSALDLKLREELRVELRALHEEHGSTIVYATHDYHNAAAIADRIGILCEGKLYQTGTLDELVQNPGHRIVGQLLGSPAMAFFPVGLREGEIVFVDTNTPAEFTLGIWPDDIELSLHERPGFRKATVYATDYRGIDKAIQLQMADSHFRKVVPLTFPAAQGDDCWFRCNLTKAFRFDSVSGQRIMAKTQ